MKACKECSDPQTPFDEQLERDFGILICDNCKAKNTNDKFTMLTKTDAKSTFLLTDEELSTLPHILKPNPRRPNWARMHLYLTMQLEELAVAKWNSLEALLEEHTRREQEQESRKKKKFDLEMKALRRKLQKPKEPKSAKFHCFKHEFEYQKHDTEEGKKIGTCKICFFSTTFEEI